MKSLLALLKGTGVKPHFSPHDFEVQEGITEQKKEKVLGLIHDPRVKTIPSTATMEEKHAALVALKQEVTAKFA